VLYPIGSTTTFGATNGNATLMKHGFDLTRGQKSPTRQFSDTLSWTAGHHSFKTGFELIKNWSNGWNTTSEQIPTAIFGNGNFPVQGITSTRFPGLQSNDITSATNILNDLAASVGGLTQGWVINSPTQKTWDDFTGDPRRFRHLTQQDWSMFFKDTWNVTSDLTLNLGIRYDKFGVIYDQKGMIARAKGGQAGIFSISGRDFSALWNPFATGGTLTESVLVGNGSPNPNESFWKNDWNNIGPTAGFSYKIPWFKRTTVVRGGYGINYAGASVILDYENDFGNSPGSADVYLPATPFVPTTYTTLSTAVLPLKPGTQPGIAIVPLTARSQAMNTPTDDHATPYIQSFNLSVQRELARGLNLEISYIGNKGTKLFDKQNLNEPNIFENGILDAFNVTRAGGNAPLFNQLLNGLNVTGVGTVNGTTLTGSEAFRRFASTRVFLANGSVAQFAGFLNNTSALTNSPGGLLRNARLPENFIVVSPQFSDAQLWGTARNSSYHSMQTQVTKQFRQGLSGQFTYTWSKALGDAVAGETAATTIDPRNRSLNKGRLAFDHTHVFTAHGTYELPFGPGKALLAGGPNWFHRIVEGWQLSTIFSYSSGDPLTLSSTVRTVGAAANLGLPNIVGDVPKSLGQVSVANGFVEYFEGISSRLAPTAGLFGSDPNNLASFSTNREVVDKTGKVLLTDALPGKVGTLGTRWIEGPGQLGLDVSLAKRIKIREGMNLAVRVDAIDALNTPQWGNPTVDINNVNFGRITSATGNRNFNVSTRFEF
jgi:hypothetical protein